MHFGRVIPVVRPQELKENFPDFSGGVGTPYIVFNSSTGEKWLLFTGWRDPVGLKREGAVAPMERDLTVNVSRIKKILPSGMIPGTYTMNAVRGLYNPVREEFIVTVTQDSEAYVFWFDSNWNRLGFKRILEGVGDHGIPFKPMGAYGYLHDAVAVIPSGEKIKLLSIRNVDDFENIRVEDYGIAAWHGGGNDVLDLLLMPRISVITESDEFGKWVLKMFMGPPLSDVKGLDPKSGIPVIGLLEGDILPNLMVDDVFTQIGHPHYTTEPDGYPKILFSSFRDTWSTRRDTGREGYVHEIYAVYVDHSIFDPRSYGVLKDRVFVQTQRELPGKWYWTGSAKKALLIYSGAEHDKVSVEIFEAASLINPEDYVVIRLETPGGCGKIALDAPGPFIRVNSIKPAKGSLWLILNY
ncbi:MAG: hypothetical protein QXI36_06050 [Candidatus Bathyarchaeia archaeon]